MGYFQKLLCREILQGLVYDWIWEVNKGIRGKQCQSFSQWHLENECFTERKRKAKGKDRLEGAGNCIWRLTEFEGWWDIHSQKIVQSVELKFMSEVYKLELEMWRLFMETKTVRMAQIPERVCRLKKKKGKGNGGQKCGRTTTFKGRNRLFFSSSVFQLFLHTPSVSLLGFFILCPQICSNHPHFWGNPLLDPYLLPFPSSFSRICLLRLSTCHLLLSLLHYGLLT